MAEEGGAADATRFNWDIFVFGSPASADSSFNISGLTADNEFGGPDGIWFDPRGVLWIQTDNSQPLDYGEDPSDQMLAVIPSRLPGDRTINPETQAQLKRFFVGPRGCEVTGVVMTPDYRTMMVNVQHPGGSWPANDGSTRPRSATVVIRREDGGEII
jgi:secreted PhoX family phosphatase